jgi:hypothetical protein
MQMAELRSLSKPVLTIALFFPFAVQGCGDGKPSTDSSLTEATVSGKVSVKGEPATGGTILFNPSNSGRIVPARTAEIQPDGRYTIKTFTGDNQVSFGGDVATKNTGVGLLKEYASVASGENTIDFDLMGPNSGKQPMMDLSKIAKNKPKKR